MRRLLTFLLGGILCTTFIVGMARAQSTQGRWVAGLYGGANMWIADFDELKIGPGGGILLRYGFTKNFSLGLIAGYEELKTNNTFQFPEYVYGYEKLKAYPAAILLHWHFAPRKSFSPYVYVGGGAMMYQRQTFNGIYVPDNKWKTSYVIPVGLGFDAFISPTIAFSLMAGFTNIDDKADMVKNSSLDGYLTAKAGLNFYFGSSDLDDDDDDGLTNGQEKKLGTDPNNADTDGDGLKDGEEVKRYKTNPLITDTDGDGLKDGDEVKIYKTDPAKADTDDDGLSDGDEILKYKTDPNKADTDGDGLSDGEEVLKLKTDPLRVDTDGDGLSDWDEVRVYKTDPNKADTDGDGLKDGDEVKKYKTDPLKIDTDAGGVNDGAEVQRGTNPLDPKDDLKDRIVLERGKSVLLEGVKFETGSARLTRESEKTLEKAFIALVANPDLSVEIGGYTDNVGNAGTNLSLSQRRAESVKSWLVRKGIDPSRMIPVGYGSKDPIAPNSTADGRARNRRIEFRVK
jgi:outer membrane protein OmpA-like peptidoglycan-associated protein